MPLRDLESKQGNNEPDAKEAEKSLLKAYKQGCDHMFSLEKTLSLNPHHRNFLEVLGVEEKAPGEPVS